MSNIIIIEGHLGADVELKNTTTNGVAVTNIRVATNRKFTNKANQSVEETTWHSVVCWDKLALTVAQFMHKGSHVLVEGRVQNREFLGQVKYDNGQVVVDATGQPILVKRYTTEIVARRVTFLDKKPNTAAYPQAAGVAYQPVPAAAPAAAPIVAGTPAAVATTFVHANPATTQVIDNAVPEVVVAAPPGV